MFFTGVVTFLVKRGTKALFGWFVGTFKGSMQSPTTNCFLIRMPCSVLLVKHTHKTPPKSHSEGFSYVLCYVLLDTWNLSVESTLACCVSIRKSFTGLSAKSGKSSAGGITWKTVGSEGSARGLSAWLRFLAWHLRWNLSVLGFYIKRLHV